MIRADLRAKLLRHRELIAALCTALVGVWIAAQGGWVLIPFGSVIAVIAIGWAFSAWRRERFNGPVTDPGLVEVLEERITYFGAGQGLGGTVALGDLSEIRLLRLRGRRFWRLKTLDGQAILIPVAATGAAALYDAFAVLPGIDLRRITEALDPDPVSGPGQPIEKNAVAQSLWSRPDAGGLDRASR